MTTLLKKAILGIAFPCLGLAMITLPVQAQDIEGVVTEEQQDPLFQPQSAAQIEAYWTEEAMAAAIPMEPPAVLAESVSTEAFAAEEDLPLMIMPGWDPSSDAPQPTEHDMVTIEPGDPGFESMTLATPLAFASPPSNPKSGPYGPFQRWTTFGYYLAFPRSIIGKLFFSLGGKNWVCSGTVNHRSMVTTAGHCNYGGGKFATNRLFCPSYFAGGKHPLRGCWTVRNSVVSGRWAALGDPDYDYSCLIMNGTGTTVANKIGNVTGWAGWAVNFRNTMTMATGYPAAAPFDGKLIVQVAAPEWYDVNFVAGGQVSKAMGNDMTGGSSGGGWFLGWNHRTKEFADTDGSHATDPGGPGGPWITGLNSHKRCKVRCFVPPTTTEGTYWQEMVSPPFMSTSAVGEYKDVYDLCVKLGAAG